MAFLEALMNWLFPPNTATQAEAATEAALASARALVRCLELEAEAKALATGLPPSHFVPDAYYDTLRRLDRALRRCGH